MTAQSEAEKARTRIGLSGWSYRHWKDRFNPAGLKQSDQLAYGAERFETVEINRSYPATTPGSGTPRCPATPPARCGMRWKSEIPRSSNPG